jgi:hypothetical protein
MTKVHNICRPLALLLIGLIILAGCQEKQAESPDTIIEQKANVMSQQISIKIGEQGSNFSQRYPGNVKIVHQPAGIDFYKIDWDASPHGTVTIENGKHSFAIEDVLGVSGDQDLGPQASEGLSEFDIYAGITASDLIAHDDARQKMYSLLQALVDKGWKPIVSPGDPRLKGKARLNYVLNTYKYLNLDPSYTPSLEEWMRIESGTDWRFYADHLYLTVNFTRERTLTDPSKPGAYLVNFNIKTELQEFREYVKPEDRQRWKELLPAALSKLPPMRAQKETELKAKGIAIDDTYRDPPIPEMK